MDMLLRLDSKGLGNPSTFNNYEHNSANGITDVLVNDQHTDDLKIDINFFGN